jgi:hypothetical protein
MLRMRLQFASIDGACGSNNKMARISPISKKCKIFISSLKSPIYRDFMIKKSLKSKRSKSHTWAPLRKKEMGRVRIQNLSKVNTLEKSDQHTRANPKKKFWRCIRRRGLRVFPFCPLLIWSKARGAKI